MATKRFEYEMINDPDAIGNFVYEIIYYSLVVAFIEHELKFSSSSLRFRVSPQVEKIIYLLGLTMDQKIDRLILNDEYFKELIAEQDLTEAKRIAEDWRQAAMERTTEFERELTIRQTYMVDTFISVETRGEVHTAYLHTNLPKVFGKAGRPV